MTEESRDPIKDMIKDMIEESGIDLAEYDAVAAALASLTELVPEEAPAPSADLAALLTGGVVTAMVPRFSRRRRLAVTAAAGAAAVVVGTGVAAASNALPDGAQRVVSNFSEKYLPFEFPAPEGEGAGLPGHAPTPVPGVDDPRGTGLEIGGGDGAGKTDNPGRHLGVERGNGQDKSQGKGQGKSQVKGQRRGQRADGKPGQAVGSGEQGNDDANGAATRRPDKPVKPTAAPAPEDATADADGGGGGGGDAERRRTVDG